MGVFQNFAVIGLFRQERRYDLLANNLSNVQTAGYKKDVPVFYKAFAEALQSSPSLESESSVTVFQQGDLQTTRNPLDLAIEGEGFFKVKTPQGTRYTRGGNFRLSKEGVLIQPNGFPVLGRNGEITIKGNSVSVAKDGTIWVDGNNQAKLALVTFSDLNGLQKEGNTLFKLVTDQEEKEADQSQVHEGTLELSNVNSLEEMIRMIDSLRSFQSCYKIVQVQDEMDGKAVNDLAKV